MALHLEASPHATPCVQATDEVRPPVDDVDASQDALDEDAIVLACEGAKRAVRQRTDNCSRIVKPNAERDSHESAPPPRLDSVMDGLASSLAMERRLRVLTPISDVRLAFGAHEIALFGSARRSRGCSFAFSLVL